DKDGFTPLHKAALKGHGDIAIALLENGAEPNAKQSFGLTPLHFAADDGQIGIVDALLAKRADINAKDNNGETALLHAVYHQQLGLARHLIERGAAEDILSASALGHGDCVRACLNQDAKTVLARNCYDLTPLHFAARAGDMAVVQLLLDAGAQVNARDYRGR